MIREATFWLLSASAALLWLPARVAPRAGRHAWVVVAAVAVAVALSDGLMDWRGAIALAMLGGASYSANHLSFPRARLAAHVAVVTLAAACFLHLLPGFHNPLLLDAVVLGPGAMPYTQYLNIDKGLAGLLLLGVYVPDRIEHDDGARRLGDFGWRFLVVVATVIALSLALGYVRWDPKVPAWWPAWVGVMLVLTALPEEAAFRGVIHSWLATQRGQLFATVAGGLAFGLAHVAGGPMYVVMASVAGIGYGWIYASTGSMAAAILAHAGLNTIHLLLFTYPALTPGG